MLDVVRSKFEATDLVEFEVVDATNLQYEDASFAAVVCQFGVMFFPDKLRSFREVHRVLESGGSYVFSVWTSWAENPFGYHDADEIFESVHKALESKLGERMPLQALVVQATKV